MSKREKRSIFIAFALIFAIVSSVLPSHVSGEVAPISEVEDKLEGISEEEKKVLDKLFAIEQKIEEIEREEAIITEEINGLQAKIRELEKGIEEKQKDYDLQLEVLEQVLVNYQKGGPATYLEILLGADSLSNFLKSLNVLKDISYNVNELLISLEEGKRVLEEKKESLNQSVSLLNQKQQELVENIQNNERLHKEQEEYLASLLEDKEYYEEQLQNLKMMWADSQLLFRDIVGELTTIISSGHFTLEDMNITFGFFSMSGFIKEDSFNSIIKEHSMLPETIFRFTDKQVIIEVPEKHLLLKGYFEISGESAITYVVSEGTFYEMALDEASIDELFKHGPLLIDFKSISEGVIAIDFTLDEVSSEDGKLSYKITPQW